MLRRQLPSIQGSGKLFYAGAWTGHGFHEDGLKSAIAIARSLGVEIPWKTNVAACPAIPPLAQVDEREIA